MEQPTIIKRNMKIKNFELTFDDWLSETIGYQVWQLKYYNQGFFNQRKLIKF